MAVALCGCKPVALDCSATCIDFAGDFAVYKPSDLRTVPLLQKLRVVDSLRISIDDLRDLSGLELVQVNRLWLTGNHIYPTNTFTSFQGLTESSASDLIIEDAPGLTSLDSLPARGVKALLASKVDVVNVDVSLMTDLTALRLRSNDALQSVRLGAHRMEVVALQSNRNVTTLEWGEGLTVDKSSFSENRSLSSCRIQEFIDDVQPDGGNRGFVMWNGPCP
ncbi:MAG: hypothetical protein ACO1OB_03525 [Archangium sp.]